MFFKVKSLISKTMDKKNKLLYGLDYLLTNRGKSLLTLSLSLLLIFSGTSAFAQDSRTIKGLIQDEKGEPIIGATVALKSNALTGTITDVKGEFQ
jgi:hypothetical protein